MSILDSPLLTIARQVCAERKIRAWLVGGAVRDALFGRAIHDWDVVVERDAIPLARATANRLHADVYVLDAQLDMARVIAGDSLIDFARLRDDDLERDLAGRDFTINALAIDLDRPEQITDLFGGAKDLEEGVIRALGEDSLTGDPVRLLRAVRQAVSLSMAIDPQTAAWIKLHAGLIAKAPAERVRDELNKTLIEPDAADSLLLLDALELLSHVLPEVTAMQAVAQSPPHHWDVYEHTRRVVDALELISTRWLGFDQSDEAATMLPVIPGFVWDSLLLTLSPFSDAVRAHLSANSLWSLLKWAALLHDIGKPPVRTLDDDGRTRFLGHEGLGAQMAAERLRALRFSNAEIDRVTGIIGGHMRPPQLSEAPVTRRAIYRFFRDTHDYGIDILLLSLADHLATHGPDVNLERWVARLGLMSEILTAYFSQRQEIVAPPPLINGVEVMAALQLSPGRQVGTILEAIREAQAAGEVTTKDEAIDLARRVLAQLG